MTNSSLLQSFIELLLKILKNLIKTSLFEHIVVINHDSSYKFSFDVDRLN